MRVLTPFYEKIQQIFPRLKKLFLRLLEKESLFTSPLQVTAPGDMIVLDRGYADYGVRAFLLHHRRDFVLFKTNPTLYRPGRRFPRHRRSGFRRAWFYRYVVRAVA